MISNIYVIIILLFTVQFAAAQQIANEVKSLPDDVAIPNHGIKYWVYFTDKNESPFSIAQPEKFLSPKSIERRNRMSLPIRIIDLPVNKNYIDEITNLGLEIVVESRWLNAVSVRINSEEQLAHISQFPFVSKIETVKKYNIIDDNSVPIENNILYRAAEQEFIEYGLSYNQNRMIAIDFLHALGYTGQGITIAVLDGGFFGVDQGQGFKSFWDKDQIIETRNFADDNDSVFISSTHGSNVLSIMGGDLPSKYLGSAPDAKFYLFRTEVVATETIVEEDYWVEAAEYADFVGADIINSSLGYTTFDDPSENHTYEDLDGNTAVATIAADVAASVGILVCNSAGNEAASDWHFIGVPADGDSVFTIGAVDASGNYASFSSVGPTADGRLKPNVVGQGAGTYYIDQSGNVFSGNGTSYSSPLIAGACASLWSAFPHLTNMEIIDIVERSASIYENPNYLIGYGIPNFAQAYIELKGIIVDKTNVLTILPNPAEEIAAVLINATETFLADINMYDISGKLIYNDKVQLNAGELSAVNLTNLSSLASGIYFIQLVGDTYIETIPMMVK